VIVIDKWAGLATNASPYSIPPGSAVTQVNLQSLVPGQLQVRPGMAAVSWVSHTGTTVPVVVAFRFQHGTQETVVYQNLSGHIRVAKGLA
jgi:hypothetical protein